MGASRAPVVPRAVFRLPVTSVGSAVAAMRATAERGVDVPRRGDLKPLHAAGERGLVLGLDDHVDVRALQAEVDDPEPPAERRGDRGGTHRLIHRASTKAAHRRHDAHHDMQRMMRLEVGPGGVPLAGAA
jgi:hypothetical protein